MDSKLDVSFFNELFKGCILKKSFFSVVSNHLKIEFLPEGAYRDIWQELSGYIRKQEKVPSFGILRQRLSDADNEPALEVLSDIKDILKVEYDQVLLGFENFVKKSKFLNSYKEIADIYNKGKKDQAYLKFKEAADSLNSFSLQAEAGDMIFSSFSKRHLERIIQNNDNLHRQNFWPIGIDLLDLYMDGGTYRGETTLFLGDSGVGKSQLLIMDGISTARRGGRVVHIQAEGTRMQVLNRYDAAWTGTLYRDMKRGQIPDGKLKVLNHKLRKIGKGDIHVFCKGKFGAFTIPDIRNIVWEVVRRYGPIDKLIIDYLDLIDPGDGLIYRASDERLRQRAISRLLKDLAVEIDAPLDTATQASSVPPEAKENPDFLLTRWNLSEDKGKLQAFDNFVTVNQTRDEKKEQIMRLYGDKFRENPNGQVIKIANALQYCRFYDRVRTIEELYTAEELRLIGVS